MADFDKQQILTFYGHQNLVYSVIFSSDDQVLASASTDCTLKLWDVKSGRCIQTLLGRTIATVEKQ
ncbi:WD40 repeat domain-containing protein [Nostoc sp.]